MITEGRKTAKALGIRRVISPEKGTHSYQVAFQFDEAGQPTKLFWNGWLTEGAVENTFKTLVQVLEFNGNEDVVSVPGGDINEGMLADQDCINRNKEVELVVENETYEGKTRARIKFVNNLGGGQFAGCSPEAVRSVNAQLNTRALFLSLKQQAQPAAAASASPAPAPTSGKFPF